MKTLNDGGWMTAPGSKDRPQPFSKKGKAMPGYAKGAKAGLKGPKKPLKGGPKMGQAPKARGQSNALTRGNGRKVGLRKTTMGNRAPSTKRKFTLPVERGVFRNVDQTIRNSAGLQGFKAGAIKRAR